MSDTAIGLLLIWGWSVAIAALVRNLFLERKVRRVERQAAMANGYLENAGARLSDALETLGRIRRNSQAAKEFGLHSPPEAAAWHVATQPHGPSVIPVFRVGGSEEGGSE